MGDKKLDDSALGGVTGGEIIMGIQKGAADPAQNTIAVEKGTEGSVVKLGKGNGEIRISGGPLHGGGASTGVC